MKDFGLHTSQPGLRAHVMSQCHTELCFSRFCVWHVSTWATDESPGITVTQGK